MKNPRDVIKNPVISEKSYKLIEENKYVFAVNPEARKEEIKDAIEAIFKVKVRSVNTLVKPGKKKEAGSDIRAYAVRQEGHRDVGRRR